MAGPYLAKLENWIKSYRSGESAGGEKEQVLVKVREQLALSLEELMRLEDEGGNPPPRDHANDNEKLARAISRIDRLIPAEPEK